MGERAGGQGQAGKQTHRGAIVHSRELS
jgi:hypothetical protein